MKKLLSIAIVLALLSPAVFAQLGNPATICDTGPTNAGAVARGLVFNTSTSVLATVSLPMSSEVAIQYVVTETGSFTGNSTLSWDTSVDGNNWVIASRTMLIASAGTVTKSVVSNWTLSATPFLRLNSITKATGNTVTGSVQVIVNKKLGL